MQASQQNAEPLHVVTVETSPAFAEIAETGLDLLGIHVVMWVDRDRTEARLEEYFPSRDDANRRRIEVEQCLREWSTGETWHVDVRRVEAQDWRESWKRFFHTQRVSPRIVIKPSWEPFTAAPGDCVIETDPGMSFGTGQHATTKACLRFLDHLSPECRDGTFLDVGCGSGILSVAAGKLGFARLAAIDMEPDAIEATRQNLATNGVTVPMSCRQATLTTMPLGDTYDVVAANVHAAVLRTCATTIAGAVSPAGAGYLLLAGLLIEQYDGIRAVYEALGFKEVDAATEAEWRSGCFRRTPTTPSR